MTELTHEELTRLLDYDPETGVFRWRVDMRSGGVKSGSIAGCRERGGNSIKFKGTAYQSRRLAWFYIYGEMPCNNLFVKNGDPHDDRIDNIGILPDKPKELTHEYLKRCIDYNPETGEFKWKINARSAVYGNDAFSINTEGDNRIRLKTTILGKAYATNRLIVFWMTGYMTSPKRVVMTIDNNAINLKWINIRVGSNGEAQMKRRNAGALAYKGVTFYKKCHKYCSQIQINGKKKHIGYFKTEAEAHAAYMKAARKHFGELANDGYQHAMYEMEYETVEREPVADELVESMEQTVDIAEGKLEPAVVHEVDF